MALPDRQPGFAADSLARGARANDNDDARPLSLEERLDREDREASELVDVPAAVVCLVCGEADCNGCEDREQSRSGIVAIVAWERPGLPALTRLWATARSTTRDTEAFFELLPDGPVVPALRFAAICELVAATAMLVAILPIAALVAPEWLRHVAFDASARAMALRVLFIGMPVFAGFLVFLHTMHALAIDLGATRNGGVRKTRSRALRFGLYACGWDLVMGPLGVLVVALKEGAKAAAGLVDSASVPSRATRAFLRGCYRLDGERARKAESTATAGVVAATGLGLVAVIAVIVALVLA